MSTNRIHELAIRKTASSESESVIYQLNDADDDVQDAFSYGTEAKAKHNQSVAFGDHTQTTAPKQMVIGSYNALDNTEDCIFIIGNGTDAEHPSNAHTVDEYGNATYSGNLSVQGIESQNITTNTLIPKDNNEPIAIKRTNSNGVEINDPIICKSDLTVIEQPYLTMSKNHGNIILQCYNLDSNKKYTLKLLTRSRYRGYRTGEWREISPDMQYGYIKLVNQPVSTAITALFPAPPSWMPNGGILQCEWQNITTDNNKIIIDCSKWLLDLCKPVAIDDVFIPTYLQNNETLTVENYVFTNNTMPAISALMGLSLTSGYRGLEFKFRLYDNDILIAETTEIAQVSGRIWSKEKKEGQIITPQENKAPSSAYVWLNPQKKCINNIFLKIV